MQRIDNNSNENRTFQLYWLSGSHETIHGPTIAEAFNRAGYGGGAIRALDFYDESDRVTHRFDKTERTWVRKEFSSVQKSDRAVAS